MVRWLLVMWAGLRWRRRSSCCCCCSCCSCHCCTWRWRRRRRRGSSMRSTSLCLRSSSTWRWRRGWIMLLMWAWMVLRRSLMMVMMMTYSPPWLLGLLLSSAMAMSMRISHIRRSSMMMMMMMARGSGRLSRWSRCFWMRLWRRRLLWAMTHLRGWWGSGWMMLIMRVWMWRWGLYSTVRLSCIVMSFIWWCSGYTISLLFIRCPSVSSWWWGWWLFRRSWMLHNFF